MQNPEQCRGNVMMSYTIHPTIPLRENRVLLSHRILIIRFKIRRETD